MLELILVRHGETDNNVKGTYCGWTDVPLNLKGISQARRAARRLRGIKFDAVYSSPLKRAFCTAEIIVSGKMPIRSQNAVNCEKPEINCSDSLKEHNFGIWEDLTYDDIKHMYPNEAKAWEKDWINYVVESGESALQVYQRISAFLDCLADRYKDGIVLLVTHLGSIKYALIHLLGMGMEDIWRFSIDNGGITRIVINDEKYAYLKAMNI